MATADQYAAWIVQNQAKRGTPDFDTVAKAYEQAKLEDTKPAPSAGFSLKDLALSFGQGVGGGTQAITDIAGAGNVVSKGLTGLQEAAGEAMSPERQAEIRRRQEIKKKAEGNTWEEVKATLGGLAEAPLQSVAQGLGSMVPMIAGTALMPAAAIPAAAARLTALGVSAGTAAKVASTLPASTIGAMMGVGGQKGQDYETVKRELLERKIPEEEAKRLAQKAAEYSLENAPRQLAGGAAGFLEGALGAEALIGRAGKKLPEVKGPSQKLPEPTVAQAIGKSTVGEAIPEGIQSAVSTIGTNQALNQAGIPTDLTQGVLANALNDALIGGVIGAGASPLKLKEMRQQYVQDEFKGQQEYQKQQQEEIAANQKKIKDELSLTQNPLGMLTVDDLGADLFKTVQQHRADTGKPALTSFSLDDVVDALPGTDKAADAASLNAIIAAKTGYTNEVYTPAQVIEAAQAKNVETGTQGFEDFLSRTTGLSDPAQMSQPQLHAAVTALGKLPGFTSTQSLPEGLNATNYTPEQFTKAIDSLNTQMDVLGKDELTFKETTNAIETATGLKGSAVNALVNDAVRSGDVVADNKKVSVPSRTTPTGYGISEEIGAEQEQATSYEVRRGDEILDEHKTKESADQQVEGLNKLTAEEIKNIDESLKTEEAKISKAEKEVQRLILAGNRSTPEFKAAQDAYEKTTDEAFPRIAELKARKESYQTPLSVAPVGVKKVKPKSYVVRKGEGIQTVKQTREEAEQAIFEDLSDADLQELSKKRSPALQKRVNAEIQRRAAAPAKSTPATAATPDQQAKLDQLKKDLPAMLERFGLKDVGLKIVNAIEGGAEGSYAAKVIEIALDAVNPVQTLRHEAIHALKELGFFTPQQWAALERQAKNEWVQKYLKDKTYRSEDGKTMSRYEAYKTPGIASKDGLTEEDIIEEAIADAFGDFDATKAPPGMLTALLNKLRNFFSALRSYLNGEGFQTYKDVFGKIEKGELKATVPTVGDESKKALRTVQDVIDDGVEKLVASAQKSRVRDFQDRYQVGFARADSALTKIQDGIENRLKAMGVSTERRSDGSTELNDIIYNKVLPKARAKLRSSEEVRTGESKKALPEAVSPLESYISPTDAASRVQRRLNRKPGVGAPVNDRIVFKAEGKKDFPVGRITIDDWIARVKNLMSKEEIKESRNWYQQLHDEFDPLFGADASEYALAWLLSQQRASPTKGFSDVLRAADIVAGKKKVAIAGLNEKNLILALQKKTPTTGVGAKLLDFIDSELGKNTRTVARGDKRARQPAAIDVWAERDIGFVDPTVMEYIRKTYGEDAVNQIKLDKTTSAETQYEYGIDFYNDVAERLNADNFMGGKWAAREIQAVGWVTMQRAMGVQAEFVKDIIGGNTRRVSIGLAPGEGSSMSEILLNGKEIPTASALKVIDEFAKVTGVKIKQNITGVGAYLTYVEGAMQIDTIGSPEAVQDFMDMVGFAFQQTEIINTRPLRSGKNMAIDVMSAGLKEDADQVKFFMEFLNNSPKDKDGNIMTPGFQPIVIDGVPGIRLLNFDGNWRQSNVEKIVSALNVTATSLNIKLEEAVAKQVVLTKTGNDWTKEHNGKQYLDSLRDRGRLQEVQLLQREFSPTRIDLAGDGTIGWGGKRYSLPTKGTAGRPELITEAAKKSENLRGIISDETLDKVQEVLNTYTEKPKVNLSDEKIAKGEQLLSSYMRKAERIKPKFEVDVKAIADAIGGTVRGTSLKSMGRSIDKLWTDTPNGMAGNPNGADILDLLRTTIVVDSESQIKPTLELLTKKFGRVNDEGVKELFRIKDRFTTPLNGYRDILTNVQLPNGTVAEIQVNVPTMITAKSSGHAIFAMSRVLPKGNPERIRLEELSKNLYEEAYLFSQKSKSPLIAGSARTNVSNGTRKLGFVAQTVEPSLSSNIGSASKAQTLAPSGTLNIPDSSKDTSIKESKKSLKTNFETAEEAENAAYRKAPPTTPEFKRFFGSSVVKEEGRPQVMYHGSRVGFNAFRENKSIFISKYPDEAEFFARGYPDESADGSDKVKIYPLWVRAETPFDYENSGHIQQVMDKMAQDKTLGGIQAAFFTSGNWERIEDRDVQAAIKALGFDSFYVKENGRKNLAVYSANQVKSVTGNSGEFGETKDMRFSLNKVKDEVDTLPNGAAINASINRLAPGREQKGYIERILELFKPQSVDALRQQFLNRYNQLGVYDKEVAEQMGGAALLADSSAESAALMSDNAAAIATMACGIEGKGGIPVFDKGYTTISNANGEKGVLEILMPLAKRGDPRIYQTYQFWAGSLRGSRLLANGTDHTYTQAEIDYAKELLVKYPEFEQVQEDWIKYNNGLMNYAVKTGVLSPEKAAEFMKYSDYIPFYRQIDGEKTVGPRLFQNISGVTPPKKLKGLKEEQDVPFADFLETIVRNTQSIIQSGMKNTAAQRAIGQAVFLKTAERRQDVSYAPGVVTVLENGKPVSYDVADQLFIDAVKSLNMPELPFLSFFAAPANLLRNLVTKDPGFMMANLMRDSLSAWVTSGAKMTPIAATIANFGRAIGGNDPVYIALRNAGVIGGYEFAAGVENSGVILGKSLRRATGTQTGTEKALKPFTSLWRGLEKGTEASDAATRMAVYKATLEKTGNEAEAIYRAMEVMNFNRKGNLAIVRILTAAVPFLNARMQGLDVFYRAAFGKMATEDAAAIQKSFFIRGATLMALTSMYWFLTHDDEEYLNQEQETRDNNWLFPSAGIRIPIPFEVGVLFKVVPERILEYSFGSDTGKDMADSFKRNLINTFAFNPIPQTVLPFVEARTNYSFFTMRPIVGQGMENVAKEYQVAPNTSEAAKKLGKVLGESPIIVDHIMKGYTGSLGMYAIDLIDAVLFSNGDSPKPAKRFEQMPVIKRFALDKEAKGTVTAYYDLKNSVDEVVRTVNLMERTSNVADMGDYIEKNAYLLGMKGYISSVEKQMKVLREAAIQIRSSDMSPEEKRESLSSITQAQIAMTANIREIKKSIEQ